MRIAFITAGAGGTYCGSCLRDNALARALKALGHQVLLIPTYTPTRTDEPNASGRRVFLGGVSLYLQERWPLFGRLLGPVSRLVDSPALLRWAGRWGLPTDAARLGQLTAAVLAGELGPHRPAMLALAQWLAEHQRPQVVDLSNALLIGLAGPLRRLLGPPVVCTLSGEDLFLDQLPEPWRSRAIELLQAQVGQVDAFITFSDYYASEAARRFRIPPHRIRRVPLGIDVSGYRVRTEGANEPVLGYLARICPEKGLHLLYEAFRRLQAGGRGSRCRLRVAGSLAPQDRVYFRRLQRRAARWGLAERIEYVGELDRAAKLRFLQSLHLFCLPTVYRECKGLPVLEALASGVPVVVPEHGAFPELMAATGGGLLVRPSDPDALAAGIAELLADPARRRCLGLQGCQAVRRQFTAERMAQATATVYLSLARSAARGGVS